MFLVLIGVTCLLCLSVMSLKCTFLESLLTTCSVSLSFFFPSTCFLIYCLRAFLCLHFSFCFQHSCPVQLSCLCPRYSFLSPPLHGSFTMLHFVFLIVFACAFFWFLFYFLFSIFMFHILLRCLLFPFNYILHNFTTTGILHLVFIMIFVSVVFCFLFYILPFTFTLFIVLTVFSFPFVSSSVILSLFVL